MTTIKRIKKDSVFHFWQLFKKILHQGFSDYSPKVREFFLKQVYTPSAFIYWIKNKQKTVFVAYQDEKPVGYAVIDRPYGGVCFCRWLGVLEEQQKKGIGRKLVEQWLEYAKSQRCHKVEIASQISAAPFYQKVGLDKEGERKLSYFGIDQIIFGKVIGKPDQEAMVSS
jgi:GNAT superfamily N-acetyltransferase